MIQRKVKKQNPILGCFISLLSIVGILVVCFVICAVIFQLNQSASASSGGGLFGFLF